MGRSHVVRTAASLSKPLVKHVAGLSISESTLCLLTDYGDGMVLYDLPTRKAIGTLNLGLKGPYDDAGFKCVMAACGKHVIATNAEWRPSFLVDVEKLKQYPHLLPPGEEAPDSSDEEFEPSAEGEGKKPNHQLAAVGIVTLPERVAEKPVARGLLFEAPCSGPEKGAHAVALAKGKLAAGYEDGSVRLQRIPSSVAMQGGGKGLSSFCYYSNLYVE